MLLLPPEAFPGVPYFFFTLFGVPVTIAYPNLTAWNLVAVVFIAAAFVRLPGFVEGKE